MEDNFSGLDAGDEIEDLLSFDTCRELSKLVFIAHREQVEQPSDYIAVPTLRIYGAIDDAFPDAILDIPPMCLDSFLTGVQPTDEYALSASSGVAITRFNQAFME